MRIDRGSMQIVEHQMISSPERKTIVTWGYRVMSHL
jgi:hypothetical protein